MKLSLVLKRLLLGLMFLVVLMLIGCGKTGEKDAEIYIKNRCNVPDSFVKVNYEINKEANLAKLDYKVKNLIGLELPGRAYFRVLNDKVIYIDTEGIDRNALEFFENHNPQNFELNVKSYKDMFEIVQDGMFDAKLFSNVMEDFDRDSYYSWVTLRKRANRVNKMLKKTKDIYNGSSVEFKQLLNQEAPGIDKFIALKYMKVSLVGDYSDWKGDIDFTDKYDDL